MATQVLPVKRPPWPMRASLETRTPEDTIDMAFERLSKSVPHFHHGAVESPASSDSSDSNSEAASSTVVQSEEFVPSRLDPVHIPTPTQKGYMRLQDEQDFSHAVFVTDDIYGSRFRGFLRSFVADRPFFDSSGPPEWVTEYSVVYEICGRIYSQKLTEDGSSMLYLKKVRNKGEYAELRVLSKSVIGRRSEYRYTKAPIFEEAAPCSETEFSALPPPRPLYLLPSRVPHRPYCLCPR